MSHADDEHPQHVIAHLVNDPVVPDPNAQKALGTGAFLDSGRARGIGEGVDPERDPPPDFWGKALQIANRRRLQLDRVTHARSKPQHGLHLFPPNRAALPERRAGRLHIHAFLDPLQQFKILEKP